MALLSGPLSLPMNTFSTQGPILWPPVAQGVSAFHQQLAGVSDARLVLLTDGKGGLFVTQVASQAPTFAPLPQQAPQKPQPATSAQPAASSAHPAQDSGLQSLLAAIDATEDRAASGKQARSSDGDAPAAKRQRASSPCSSESNTQTASAAQRPASVQPASPNRGWSDDESGCSSKTLQGSGTSSLVAGQQAFAPAMGEASATSHGPVAPMLVRLGHTAQGTVVLPSSCALVQQSALAAQPQPGLPLSTPLQVPAGMLLPTSVGYELRPAQPSSQHVQAALPDPSCSMQELATQPLSKVVPSPWSGRDRSVYEAALAEIQQVCRHKPRGRPVKYLELGVNRMALKFHVGIKIDNQIQSVGACDTETAAHMLLDMAKIGLGLFTDVAHAAPPSANVHPQEQTTAVLHCEPWQYSTVHVQRVVAQLINRNLVPASELLHAYTRAHTAGCRPGPCLMSVSAALSASQ